MQAHTSSGSLRTLQDCSPGPSGTPLLPTLSYGAPGEKIKQHMLAQGLPLSLPPQEENRFYV